MEYLIDPNGRWWRWPSPLLEAELGYENPDFDLAGYAARNLGYLWISMSPELTMLQFRAGGLTPRIVNEAATFLHKSNDGQPIALVYFASGWMEEVSTDAGVVAARLAMLAALPEPLRRPPYLRRSCDPMTWQTSDRTTLSSLFALWRANGAILDDRVVAFISGCDIASRTIFVEPEGERFRIVESGAGFTIYDGTGVAIRTGGDMFDQPDKGYGAWVNGLYRNILAGGMPSVDDIDAIVEAPGHDPRRRRYRRLVLPWRDRAGRMILTGSSVLDPVELSIPLDLAQTLDPGPGID